MMNTRKRVPRSSDEIKILNLDGQCMSDLLWEQVKLQPNNVAVTCNDSSLTYSELAEHSMGVALHLQYLSVAPDECVGLFVEPSIDLMIGAWGILTSGSAYLPLSPEYPEERLKYMIEDSGVRVIFAQEELKEKLSQLAPPYVQVITLKEVKSFQASCHEELKKNVHPHNLAYIIYTSGSTGKPKGVMIEHRSIVNQMQWLQNTFHLNHQSVILQKTPMSFDAAQWEILALSCGSRVVMSHPGAYKNPGQLIETIIKHGVTILQCVPTLLQALLDTDEFHHCKTLTQIFSGGEALSKHLALECTQKMPNSSLVNLYGPTECTINTSALSVDARSIEESSGTISIGKAIDNMQYYILNDQLSPVAEGEIGELHIDGAGLARGYLGQPKLTSEKFIANPFDSAQSKLYKTGDLAYWNADGSVQYAGRADSQVKLRGFRIELDEIKSSIESHDWVKSSAVILKNDPYTGYQNLIAFIELNSKEAALMDQGNHDSHHQSKTSKAQVIMQLAGKGLREQIDFPEKYVVNLPGSTPTKKQTQKVFARKSYRFFEGGDVTKDDILQLLNAKMSNAPFCTIEQLSHADFGEVLRYFGQYISEERLLPKYGYASPGALYATQMYLELSNVQDLKSGYYYYHPVHHQLILIQGKVDSGKAEIKLHFIGKKSAIEPIYKNNIQEVLEIETGHMVGLFEETLPEYGLSIKACEYKPAVKDCLDIAVEDFYLGSFRLMPGKEQLMDDSVDIYVQVHPGQIPDLKAGQYQYKNGNLEFLSDKIILRKDVIAINQAVYDRSSFGITVVSKKSNDWMSYIHLGRKLQKLQMNDLGIGFMSSGYSSKTGHDLPSAKVIKNILNADVEASYFFIGGRVSPEQICSQGMKEDTVHMKGPAEMIKDDLVNFLPDYMLPNQVIVLDQMPLTVNGKIDFQALKNKQVDLVRREYIAPRTEIEQKICNIWKREIKKQDISINDNFFELGGNSLIAVSLINRINKELGLSLSLQVLFEAPTVEKLARKAGDDSIDDSSRLIRLQPKGNKKPVYCWPGLGGYCMNLRLLAEKVGADQPFYGIQAHGINKGELPYSTIKDMAAADIRMIKKIQPVGPYTLWGYSFGAKVAFEAAYQLEQSGEKVENLFLIAPGSPKIQGIAKLDNNDQPGYDNKIYLTILYSVFMGGITGRALDKCLELVNDEASFVEYIMAQNDQLDSDLVKRIINIVSITYGFRDSGNDIEERQIAAPITIFKAKGDKSSFIESGNEFASMTYLTSRLNVDHYSILKNPNIEELVKMIKLQSTHIFGGRHGEIMVESPPDSTSKIKYDFPYDQPIFNGSVTYFSKELSS